MFFAWVSFLISLGSPHVRPMKVHRTCGEPNDIELTPHRVELNGLDLQTSQHEASSLIGTVHVAGYVWT